MAAKNAGDAGGKKGGGLVPLILLTLVAAGAGAAHGLQTFSLVQAAGPQKPASTEVAAAAPAGHGAAPKPEAGGHGAPAKAEGGHGAPAGGHGAPAGGHGAPPAEKAAAPVKLPSKIVIRDLAPVVTNVALPPDSWVRLEASIIYDQADLENAELTSSEISGDLMAFMRTVSLREIQGPEGLMYLRQELRERIALRTERKVKDIVIQTLVVQ